jgi:DNA-binding response OmpR family regulator
MSPAINSEIASSATGSAQRNPLRLAMAEPVLIIDDNYHAAIELARLLEELDIATHCVGRPEAAREAARTLKPALALVDINLAGGFEGVELAQEMRALYGTKVVFVTAYHVRDLMHRLGGAEDIAVLFKPVQRDLLETVLELAARQP